MLGPAGSALVNTGDKVLTLMGSVTDLHAPALGTWDVAGLCGHLLRAFRTPLRYLADDPAPAVDLPDAAAYFAAHAARRDDDAAAVDRSIAARGVSELDATATLDQIRTAYRTTLSALRDTLVSTDDTFIVAGPLGGIALEAYLETRVFEATVHSLDLSRALGRVEWSPPDEAVALTLQLLTELALLRNQGSPLVLALTGRDVPIPILLQ
jgi:hypothetical protein